MTRISRSEFIDACHDLDQEAFVAFVAALYRARGHSIEQSDDRRISTTRGDSEADFLIVAGSGPPATVDADAVILARADPPQEVGDLPVVDLTDLHEQLVYAVDRDEARTIAREHLGIDFERAGADSGHRSDPTGEETGQEGREDQAGGDGEDQPSGVVSSMPRDRRAVLLIGLVVTVAGVSLLGALATGDIIVGETDPPPDPDDGPTVTPARTPTADAAGGSGDTSTSTSLSEDQLSVWAAESGSYEPPLELELPPGVTVTGVTNPKRLARAHRQSLSNASYTFQLDRQEFVDGKLTGTYSQTLRVENGSRYVLSDTLVGNLQTTPMHLGAGQPDGVRKVGTDTSDLVLQSGNGTLTGVTLRIQHHLTELLTAPDSEIVARSSNARAEYKLSFEGAPGSGANGIAFVSERGRVRFGRWTYKTPGERSLKVVTTVRLTEVGSTQVAPAG